VCCCAEPFPHHAAFPLVVSPLSRTSAMIDIMYGCDTKKAY
jgi:hypothetical protein